ncbi:MAG: hypothetical protein V3U96_03320 [Paracoccaceae bacterium]
MTFSAFCWFTLQVTEGFEFIDISRFSLSAKLIGLTIIWIIAEAILAAWCWGRTPDADADGSLDEREQVIDYRANRNAAIALETGVIGVLVLVVGHEEWLGGWALSGSVPLAFALFSVICFGAVIHAVSALYYSRY